MPLPSKPYFFLEELASAWGASMGDLACYVCEGKLVVWTMVAGTPVEVGISEQLNKDEWFNAPTGHEWRRGLQPLDAADLWPVFRAGAGRIRRFKADTMNSYVAVREDDGIEITVNDLVVKREERERFESAYALRSEAQIAQSLFSHSEDYTSVILSGQAFVLGPRQAAVVRLLDEASRSGDPWIAGSDLLRQAGAGSSRMVDLFKAKQNWRDLIKSDGHGRWRLNLPCTEERQRTRAYRRPRLALVSSR